MTGRYGAKASAAFRYNPLSIAWDHAWWSEDPGWTPPADGAVVSSWRDAGVQAKNATQATGANQPIYRVNYVGLNSRPAIEFDGIDDYLDTAATTARTQPNHVVVVGYISPTATDPSTPIDSTVSGTRHLLRPRFSATTIQMYAGLDRTFTAPTASLGFPFIQIGLFNGASSECRLNSTVYNAAAVGDVGAFSVQNPRIGASFGAPPTSYFKGGLVFVGIKDTALTAAEIANLEAWARASYGIAFPIADPSEVPGLKMWLAADDGATLTSELHHVDFPDTGGNHSVNNYLRIPNHSDYNIPGDISVTTHVAPDVWSGGGIANAFVSKWLTDSGGPTLQASWYCGIADNGMMRLVWSPDGGATLLEALSTVTPPGVVNGGWMWLAWALDVDNGAGGNSAYFWYATDAELIWRAVGTPVTKTGITSIAVTNADILVGGFFTNAVHNYSFSGNVNLASVSSGIAAGGAPLGAGVVDKLRFTQIDVPDNSNSTFKASTGQTVTINRGGSTPAATVAVPDVKGKISQWRDKSGGNYHVAQTAQDLKPSTGVLTIGGRAAIYFDGGDVLMYAGNTGLNAGNATVFVVAGQNSPSEGVGFFCACNTGTSDWSSAFAFTMTVGTASAHLQVERYYQAAGVGQAIIAGTGATPQAIWATQLNGNGLIQAWRNGGVAATSTRGGTFGVSGAGFLVAGRWQAGAIDPLYRLLGPMGEIIVYSRALGLSEINLVGKYLADRWGFAWAPAT